MPHTHRAGKGGEGQDSPRRHQTVLGIGGAGAAVASHEGGFQERNSCGLQAEASFRAGRCWSSS